jgi:hypothetical protein
VSDDDPGLTEGRGWLQGCLHGVFQRGRGGVAVTVQDHVEPGDGGREPELPVEIGLQGCEYCAVAIDRESLLQAASLPVVDRRLPPVQLLLPCGEGRVIEGALSLVENCRSE